MTRSSRVVWLLTPSYSSWGQWVMFEVQPGKSFHSVEEVTVETDEFGGQRLSISGWFHKAQPGEEDYEEDPVEQVVSSRNQLVGNLMNRGHSSNPFQSSFQSR